MSKFYQKLGLSEEINYYVNRPRSFYIQEAVRRGYARLSIDGSLLVETGKHTGRSAKDRYIVKSPTTEKDVWWENNLSPMTPETFGKLKAKVLAYFGRQKEL